VHDDPHGLIGCLIMAEAAGLAEKVAERFEPVA
jgi:hypothetical protein